MERRIPLATWGQIGGCLGQLDWSRLARVCTAFRVASKQAHATPALLRVVARHTDSRAPGYAAALAYMRPRSIVTDAVRGGPSNVLIRALLPLAHTLASLVLERRRHGPTLQFESLSQLTALRHLRLVIDANHYSTPVFPAALTSLDFRVVAGNLLPDTVLRDASIDVLGQRRHDQSKPRATWDAATLPCAALVALELCVCDAVRLESDAAILADRLVSLTSLVAGPRFESALALAHVAFPRLTRLTIGVATRRLETRRFPALTALSLGDPELRHLAGIDAALVLQLLESLPTVSDLTLDVVNILAFSVEPAAVDPTGPGAPFGPGAPSSSSSSSSSVSASASVRRQLRRLTLTNFVAPLFCECLARRSTLDMALLAVRAPAFCYRAFAAHSIARVEAVHLELDASTDYVVPTGRFVRRRADAARQEPPGNALDPRAFRVSEVGCIATLVVLDPRDVDECARRGTTDVARPHTLELARLPATDAELVASYLAAVHTLFPHVCAVRLPAYSLRGRYHPVAAALGDLYAGLAQLETIDLSRLSIGDLEPPVSPREFVKRYVRPEQRRLVTRLPSLT